MIQSTHISKLEEIPPDFDLIINCAGIGARELVHDPDLEPHRGQVAIVSKLDLPQAIVCDDTPLMYAIPRARDCLFGGKNSVSHSREPSPTDTEAIVSECSRVLGISNGPRVTAVKVGLRPFRKSGVRLEPENYPMAASSFITTATAAPASPFLGPAPKKSTRLQRRLGF